MTIRPLTPLDTIILNGTVVTAADIARYDIGIKDGKIALLAPAGSLADPPSPTTRIIDAQGAYVMPGGVDAHVHLAEPQLFGKGKAADDYCTGTKSAIAGGTTTIIAFAPQDKSSPSLIKALDETASKAAGVAYCDYSFHLLIGNPTREALDEFALLRDRGISSVKIYMTYELLQLRDNQILDVLLQSRIDGVTTMIHAENGDMLSWMTEQLEARGLLEPKYHATSRPQILEKEATGRAIALSQLIETPILIVHVSSPLAAGVIRDAQTSGLPIYAETCPQYLFLTRDNLAKPGYEGAKCVCSPPPRDGVQDLEGIWRGLSNGTFTILSSDHCPFEYDNAETGKKAAITEDAPLGRFRYIPNGCPGVETRLPLVLSAGRLSPQKFVEVTSTNPAKLYGLYPQKGALIPGVSDADLVIWYPEGGLEPFELKNEMLHHNVDYTPFEGRTLTQWPRYTLLRGEVVWDRDNGGVVGEKGVGKFVTRGRSEFCQEQGPWDPTKF
ncbi:Putative Catalytic activity: dihydropyrimidinase catalyzes the conversion of 5 [Aspergillus calidoustus]|uniref:Putative Catalytic activity: dihydropyrimidinase catalyzes the conversion of 5 n=1 Tax=Aspergillus calidoustus TaxID=454130 RepID=A0A0U5CJ56_ASPCI|nr:Putative Catalytic activity: dihydropyrimidinase catalyzes the conversion of 5 [Aspergillus calidoustus]